MYWPKIINSIDSASEFAATNTYILLSMLSVTCAHFSQDSKENIHKNCYLVHTIRVRLIHHSHYVDIGNSCISHTSTNCVTSGSCLSHTQHFHDSCIKLWWCKGQHRTGTWWPLCNIWHPVRRFYFLSRHIGGWLLIN